MAALVVAGSVGRGLADVHSDLELDIYWHAAPSEQDRLGAIEKTGAELVTLWPYEPAEGEWAENYRYPGIDVGVSGFLVPWMASCIADVVDRCDPDVLKQVRLAALNDGVVLLGEDLVRSWRRSSRAYPAGLADAVARHYLALDRLGSWHQRGKLTERGDVLMLRRQCARIEDMILGTLCAVNHVLIDHPSFKWTAHLTQRLTVAPTDLRRRLWAAADGSAARAAEILGQLLIETLELVERHLPNVDLTSLRSELSHS